MTDPTAADSREAERIEAAKSWAAECRRQLAEKNPGLAALDVAPGPRIHAHPGTDGDYWHRHESEGPHEHEDTEAASSPGA